MLAPTLMVQGTASSVGKSLLCAALCRFFISVGLGAPELESQAPYDLVVANILAGPLMELSETFGAAIRSGGRVLLSGLRRGIRS